MKGGSIILLILLVLALLYFFKPDIFNQYVKNPVMSVVNPIIHPSTKTTNTQTQTTPNTENNLTAQPVPQVLGKPKAAYNCASNSDCQTSYPQYNSTVVCNTGSGECELPITP